MFDIRYSESPQHLRQSQRDHQKAKAGGAKRDHAEEGGHGDRTRH